MPCRRPGDSDDPPVPAEVPKGGCCRQHGLLEILGMRHLIQHKNDGSQRLTRDGMAPDVEVPGQQLCGQAFRALACSQHQNGARGQRLSGLVAAEDGGLGQTELPGHVPA